MADTNRSTEIFRIFSTSDKEPSTYVRATTMTITTPLPMYSRSELVNRGIDRETPRDVVATALSGGRWVRLGTESKNANFVQYQTKADALKMNNKHLTFNVVINLNIMT